MLRWNKFWHVTQKDSSPSDSLQVDTEGKAFAAELFFKHTSIPKPVYLDFADLKNVKNCPVFLSSSILKKYLLQIHKLMAGLLDHYNFLGSKLALEMVVDEAGFFQEYVEDVLAKEGKDHWIQMLEVEFGGMEEVLFNLYQATQDEQWQWYVSLMRISLKMTLHALKMGIHGRNLKMHKTQAHLRWLDIHCYFPCIRLLVLKFYLPS